MSIKEFRTNTFLSWIALAIILLIGYNTTVNIHSHKLLDGRIITHAHPYKKSADAAKGDLGHKHSSSAYSYLDQIFNLLQIIIILSFLGLFVAKLTFVSFTGPKFSEIDPDIILSCKPRGPPVSSQ